MDIVFYTAAKICEQTIVLGYSLVFFGAFAESLAIVGSFVPGGLIVILSGFLTVHECFQLLPLIFLATAGAIAGDTLSYYVGTKGVSLFHDDNVWLKRSHLSMAEAFFQEHGDKSVFLGRFIGIIRPIVPFVAGLSGMPFRVFIVWDVMSGILWAISHVLIGYFIGRAADSFVGVPKVIALLIVLVPVGIAVLWWRATRRPINPPAKDENVQDV